jgi:hypothetical protein
LRRASQRATSRIRSILVSAHSGGNPLNRQLSIVANVLRILGVLVGVPSLAALAVVVPDVVFLHRAVAMGGSHNLDIQKYGLVALLANAANGVGSVLGFFAGVGSWVLTVLSVVLFALVLLATALYFTGAGLARRAAWARIVAGLIFAGTLLVCTPVLVFTLTSRPALGVIPAVPVGASVYALWVLVRRFA